MQPTSEQQVIIEAAHSESHNMVIEALAGSAKTTTLQMIAEALPQTRILCLAFNKAIAEEMKERMPGNVECRTFNSIGHGILRSNMGKVTLNKYKMADIVDRHLAEIPREKRPNKRKLVAMCRKAKAMGYLPGDDSTIYDLEA